MPEQFLYFVLIPLLPLAGFLLTGLLGKRFPCKFSGIFTTGLLLVSCLLACWLGLDYFLFSGKTAGAYQSFRALDLTWLPLTKDLSIDLGIMIDPISVMMMIVVTTVSLMVHWFSLWYMKGEERYPAYFSFLSLFTFSMLGLVMATNIFQMYIFWELVGVSSYLLIGFYYTRPAAVSAAKKAFIVTRFADLGFLIGILILAYQAHTLDISLLIERLTDPHSAYFLQATSAGFMGLSLLTWALLLVFMGGMGKSAMFPLHIWLPDAMEGPTPVSALIHAATMVVAGVYLVARLFVLYAKSATFALEIVAVVGVVSAFLAALIACTQTDIKRVLAYSTISQIGYMMLAAGVASFDASRMGYTASMFHLFTHAWFKALLFLCAGVVIHWVHSNEMGKMGGLRKLLPVTHITFLAGCLAISGIPPFSGFFSKEAILSAAYEHNTFLFVLAFLTAGLTSFYMFRLYFGIFWHHPPEKELQQKKKALLSGSSNSEGPWSMKLPLIILGLGAAGAGFLPFHQYVTPGGTPVESHFHLTLSTSAILLSLAGIAIAGFLYKKENAGPQLIAGYLKGFYRIIYRKFYFDEIYLFIAKGIIFPYISRPFAWFDRHVVDGVVNGVAGSTAYISVKIKGFQSGKVQQYFLYFFLGVLVFGLVFLYFRNI